MMPGFQASLKSSVTRPNFHYAVHYWFIFELLNAFAVYLSGLGRTLKSMSLFSSATFTSIGTSHTVFFPRKSLGHKTLSLLSQRSTLLIIFENEWPCVLPKKQPPGAFDTSTNNLKSPISMIKIYLVGSVSC